MSMEGVTEGESEEEIADKHIADWDKEWDDFWASPLTVLQTRLAILSRALSQGDEGWAGYVEDLTNDRVIGNTDAGFKCISDLVEEGFLRVDEIDETRLFITESGLEWRNVEVRKLVGLDGDNS